MRLRGNGRRKVDGPWNSSPINGDMVASTVLPAIGDDVPRHEAKNFAGSPPEAEVNAILAVR